jgi:pimeloyl-ACP methyl ester carboxylesterase
MLQRHADLVDAVVLHAPVGAYLDRRRLPTLMRPRLVRWMAQQALASPVLRPVWRRTFFRSPVPDHIARKFFTNYRKCAAFSPMFDQITPRWFASLAPVDIPAVLLWGDRERVLAPSHAEGYRTLLPRAQVVVEPGWDHFPMIDAPQAYARRVADLAQHLV